MGRWGQGRSEILTFPRHVGVCIKKCTSHSIAPYTTCFFYENLTSSAVLSLRSRRSSQFSAEFTPETIRIFGFFRFHQWCSLFRVRRHIRRQQGLSEYRDYLLELRTIWGSNKSWPPSKNPSKSPAEITISINAPLILKMREIIFCGQITLWAISKDILRGKKKSRLPQNTQ